MADVDVLATANVLTNERYAIAGPFWTSPSVGYIVLQDVDSNIDVFKTSDSGATWAAQDTANNPASFGTRSMGVYWDKQTKDESGALIHIAWVEPTSSEVHYISFNTADDTYGTNRTVDALTISGTSGDSDVSICIAKSGRIYICARGDFEQDTENTDHSMLSSDNSGATWDARTAPYSADEEQM